MYQKNAFYVSFFTTSTHNGNMISLLFDYVVKQLIMCCY